MNIDELTIGQVKQIKSMCGGSEPTNESPYKIGQAYLIRLVTHYWIGRVVSVCNQEIVLNDAAWIPDTGRYHQCVATGSVEECEPVPDGVIIGRGAIVDAVEWNHAIPEAVK